MRVRHILVREKKAVKNFVVYFLIFKRYYKIPCILKLSVTIIKNSFEEKKLYSFLSLSSTKIN